MDIDVRLITRIKKGDIRPIKQIDDSLIVCRNKCIRSIY